MAEDCLAVMRALGHERFMVAGHDRGGRVAYRLALDHPEAVARLVPLDIVPTAEVWRRTNAEGCSSPTTGRSWRSRIRMPETLIGKDPSTTSSTRCKSWAKSRDLSPFSAEALAHYRALLAGSCARARRAARTIAPAPPSTAQLDEADLAAGRKIACPTFVLWAAQLSWPGDPLEVWRTWCTNVDRRRGRIPGISWPRKTRRTRWPRSCRSSSP